jgi:ribosomal protein S12 methylthiotransferase
VQARISASRLRQHVGQTVSVLVDGHDEHGDAIARSAADAPEIDGIVRVHRGAQLPIGEFARVRITDADEHDLVALPS